MEETITVVKSDDLDKLLTDNPEMSKTIQNIIRKVLRKGRSNLAKTAKSVLASDPRQAYRAVKSSVYRTIAGGSLSILAKRHASSQRVRIERTRLVDQPGPGGHGHRGGNRRKRSERTDQIDSYYGSDRGFILRFINAGTAERNTAYGRRGSISPRNWFPGASQAEMEQVAENFCKYVEEEINKIAKQNNVTGNN